MDNLISCGLVFIVLITCILYVPENVADIDAFRSTHMAAAMIVRHCALFCSALVMYSFNDADNV